MLERATACLKAGARDSLKCAQHAKAQVPRTASRRRLHSTFWTHGAGDIDCDISLLGVGAGKGAGADLVWRHDDIHSAGPAEKRSGKETGSATAASSSVITAPGPDAPFLDFLYPPPALAWLQRCNGQPWERWERRNARRLPEGFVQASRGYSSRSHARSAEAKGQPGGLADESPEAVSVGTSHASKYDTGSDLVKEIEPEEEHSSDSAISMRDEATKDSLDTTTTPFNPQKLAGVDPPPSGKVTTRATVQMVREMTPGITPVDEATMDATDEDEMLSDTVTAISPGDISEDQARDFDHVADPLEALRTMITSRRKVHTLPDISRAWSLYTSLSETVKTDPRLMHELLVWFSKMDVETARAHAISLFWSMPLERKTLPDYEAVLRAFLKRRTYDAVVGVHQEALRNIPNGHQITKQLFNNAVYHDDWQLALAVKEDHDAAFEGDGSTEHRRKALFWIDVAEIPDLIQKAEALVRKCRWYQRRRRNNVNKFTAFSARMSEEAFRQTLVSPSDWKPSQVQEQGRTRSLLVTLLDSIRLWNPIAPRLFEEFLVRLVDLNQSEAQYRQVHNIVSYIYGHYREMPDVQPSEQLLQSMLERVLQYSIPLAQLRFSAHSVSIEVIVEDWQKHHTILNLWAVKRLMQYYARQGMPMPLDGYYTYLKRHYPSYGDQESALDSLIYVHARRAEPEKAQKAFDHVNSLAKMNERPLKTKCWNMMMHAHARADDLVGGFDNLSRMVDDANMIPDERTIHPLLEMLARRGDLDGIDDLLKQYDSLNGAPHATSFIGSRMRALINSGQVPEAEQTLKKAIQQVRNHDITGSLTTCFNIMISAYAQRRDIEATMRTYRWMKAENIRLDSYTYTCLMLSLIHFRQTPAAYTIMTKVMRKEGFEPTAVHYAIVMTGLIKQGLYDRAIWVHQKMSRKNIRPSLATRRNYMKALGMKDRAEGKAYNPDGEPAPLMQVINELRDALIEHDGSEIASKDPVFGHDPTGGMEDIREHFVAVIFAHGKHRCFEAVRELFSMYQEEVAKSDKAHTSVPMRVLTAMMNTHLHSEEYDQVEAYWNIAKDNADRIAPNVAVPDLAHPQPSTSQLAAATSPALESDNDNPTRNEVDQAEIGFGANRAASVEGTQTLLPASVPSLGLRPSPGRRTILTRPLRYLLRALAAQNRIADVLTTFTALVRQGYTFDSITWNRLIEYLCTASPPLALLAFTLTERYLMPNFPGWTPRYMTRRPPRKSAVAEGLQFIRGRYLSYDALVPQYRTMVYLTAALLKLRRMEATGSARTKGEAGRFVGTMRQIETMAPRTLDAVNSMPQVEHDRLQHQLLRSDKANEL